MNLPELSVRNPVTAFMSFLVVIVVGAVCFLQLPLDLMPKIEIPAVTVVTRYGGAGPTDVETKVTKVLEDYLSTVPQLKHISSVSKEDMSVITLSFEWDTDMDTRANEVRDAAGMAKLFLPDDVDEPRIFKFDLSRFPIIVLGVTAGESYPKLEKILQDQVADPLKRLPGVASVGVRVPLHRQVNVHVDRERMAGYGLTLPDIVYAIHRENRDVPAGNVELGAKDFIVRVPGEYRDVGAMGEIVVASVNGAAVRLGDLAEVEDGYDESQRRFVTINGRMGGILLIQKESGANTVRVARAVRERLADLTRRLPPDVKLLSVMDGSEDIERMVGDLWTNLWQGGLLAMLVVLVFLRQWRGTLVIGLTIPFSLILALIVNFFLGYSINMMTLFGLIIAIGMVVDNAIVVLENITRHRESGERPEQGSYYGASEVGTAVMASTLTTVCIFFPIVFVRGMTRIFFREFALVVTVTLMASLFSSMTLTPMLTSTLMRKVSFERGQGNWFFRKTERGFNRVVEAYARILGWSLRHRKAVVMISLLVFLSSVAFVPFLGTEFMPQEDRGMMQGMIYLPVGTRTEETARALEEMGRIIREEVTDSERVAVWTSCGKGGGRLEAAMNEEGSHMGQFGLKLVPRVERRRDVREIAEVLRKRIEARRSALNIEKVVLDTADPMEGMMSGGEKALTVNIIGEDMEATDALAVKVREIVAGTQGAVDVNITREYGRPEVSVDVRRDKTASLGLTASSVGDAVRAAFYGTTASKFRARGEEFDVMVRFRREDRAAASDLGEVPIRLRTGALVRADNVADVEYRTGPVEIRRKDQGRIVSVTGGVYKRSLGQVVKDIETKLADLDVPPGVEVLLGGQTEDQREAFFWLGLALLVGMMMVYMVMASQFESLRDPFVVMFSVPFAFTGVVWALVLGGHHVGIIVLIGLLLLIGVVVNNAIVLVDFINILRGRGLPMAEAVQEAGRSRLRPVLMTALTTIVALIPMAFGKGQGFEVWNPLGATVLGGMIVSTLVTMVLVPTVYSLFEARRGVFAAPARKAADGGAGRSP